MSKNRTPGSTTAYALSSLTSRTRSMRVSSTTTDPATRGDAPPYALFLPRDTVHSGTRSSLATRTIACTSSTEDGDTTAPGANSAVSPNGYGSR